MPNITIRDIPDNLYADIKRFANEDRRTINSQIIVGLSEYVSRKKSAKQMIRELKKIHENMDMKGFELSPEEMEKIINEGRP